MKICNSAALVLLALVSVRSVQGLPVPESSHPPPVEGRALSIFSNGGSLPPTLASNPNLTKGHIAAMAVIAALVYGGVRLVEHFDHDQSGTSPTNGRRAVATTTPAADTLRDPIRREAADYINAAKPIALNVEYHQVVGTEPEKNARALATEAMITEA
ncbi:unnamed protein product [Tilletia controversa]|uniref:Uncharacterized protein n=3 Tax=Tilletia TaxID=13289 RepID=A0A8X7MIH4_9BASI|nr:hypothetical protein CF335_g9560 [Tilletia laevis]KAE8236382.1 hypothetical protein A4X06_0g9566 [Tilletia controversa]CAD7061261.1 unnamed protein product [Tilletia caries]KAE8180146.1 hypothetical protein CF336_g9392 [Tilletia laevis]CAD6938476.1 unnamed protein product [Tilletia laevis]